MRVLITGACGFVGSSLAESLVERRQGLAVIGLDNLIRPGSETNRARLRKLGIEFIHADIRAASDLENLPAGLHPAQQQPRVFDPGTMLTASQDRRECVSVGLLGAAPIGRFLAGH